MISNHLRITLIIILLATSLSTTRANSSDTTLQKKKFNIGLSLYSLVRLPLISVDYRISEKYVLNAEVKPRFNLMNFDGSTFVLDNYLKTAYWENSYLKGFSSFVSMRKEKITKKQKIISHGIEAGFIYKYGKEIRINVPAIESSYNKYDNLYYDFYSKCQFLLNYQFSYGNESVRLYASTGVSYNLENKSGYSYRYYYEVSYNHVISRRFLAPELSLVKSFSPYVRVAVRLKLSSIKKLVK